ncbi:chemotaxis protein CheA [Pararhodospirillum photometricum]|uniref:Chemotaxis protein CheA n=1 Tax=Pararhodospirillum photometricum DSM 122 TaxID=1150469 RepID=H6SPR5_PARPM|nr:chemotaxis protein CheA [Pararhodospirillum photometricum]CCG07185.1 CheA Signal Transduction Histidine Kinases (STHK) [Pararhodospirillum photometricum DSM 122]
MSTPLLLRFVSEARDLLQTAASGLLALERTPDDAVLNEVFRAVHTIKGSVGLFDFPAFSRLVHAGEDVLSAVRAQEMSLDSELVDHLLDSLDRMGAWIDEIEQGGSLSPEAEGVSRALTEVLRAALPQKAEALQEQAPARAGTLDTLDWLAALPERDRLAAFAEAARGTEVLALVYTPVEDCFFSGEDPLNLLRQLPLLALDLTPRASWPPPESLDPYTCLLCFRALTPLPRLEVETLFRYVLEQVALIPITPDALMLPHGEDSAGPVFEDFTRQARTLIAAGDLVRLERAVSALLELSGPETRAASALRWMQATLALPAPPVAWLERLVLAISGEGEIAFPSPRPPVRAPTPLDPLSRRLLESQRTLLMVRDSASFQSRLASVARTGGNILRALGLPTEPWEEVTAGGQADRILAELSRLLEEAPPPAPAAPTSSPLVETGPAPASLGGGNEPAASPEARSGASRVLKVDQARIDGLMNLIGELVVSKNSLPFLARRAENVHGSREMAREIKDLYAVVDRLAQEMQTAIMAVRMLPVSEVFERFPRLVRDVARRLGKQVELVIEGEETAADKNIIEVMGDPLLHIVRNALDHGLEGPAERVAAGKPATARLLVRAFQESDQVVIEVADDGRGIDPVRIREAAVAKGAVSADRAAHLTEQEAVNLVFLPGFSTASAVTDLSGRGVGMDVVATTVEKAAGSVTLTSVLGQGTTVRLALPLSMAVTRVMMVETGGGMLFGIPMDHIAETVRIPHTAIRRIKRSEAFVLRDAIVPLLRLDELLGLAPRYSPHAPQEEEAEDAVLVVRLGGTLTGLVVDHFREGMDIILKPFDGILSGIRGYAGTALLGDGRVLLVLNLKELL